MTDGSMRRGSRFQNTSSVTVGVVGLILLLIGSFLLITRDIPFVNPPFEIKVAFSNASNIQPASPVRIAGVEAGEVTKIEKQGQGAVVTMKMEGSALPVHKDASAKIRPRIFLEGNFFVDLKPGTPQSGDLSSGGTIPSTQTAAPVQIDQVLTSLQLDTRNDLRRLLQGYGDSLNGQPLPGEDNDQDPDVKGLTAGEALNKSLDYAPAALKGVALVNQAVLGTENHDLSKLIGGQARVSGALASREAQLQDLVSNLNTTMAAFAGENENLSKSIHELPGTLQNANSTFTALNQAFPPTRAFAREILPGVRETPTTIDASFPWISQTRKLLAPGELQGLSKDLQPATSSLSTLTDQTLQLLPSIDLVNQCALNVLLPTGDLKIDDGALSTGAKNYQEFWQGLVGLSGESQNFDGNGGYTRFQPGGGSQTVSTGTLNSGGAALFGNAADAPLGTRPAFPGKEPPYVRTQACYKQQIPDLDAAKVGKGP